MTIRFTMKMVLIALLFSAPSFGKRCELFEVSGTVRSQKDHLVLAIAEGTQSDKKIKISQRIQSEFAPYINHDIKTMIVMDGLYIMKVNSIERIIIDHLNRGGHNTLKNLGEVPCP